jgi:hypothetical protein
MAWLTANWQAACSVLGAVLGVVSMVLHLLKINSSSVDSAQAFLNKVDGQNPPST